MTNEEAQQLIAEFKKQVRTQIEDDEGSQCSNHHKIHLQDIETIINRFANKLPACGWTITLEDPGRIINIRPYECDQTPNLIAELGIRCKEKFTSVRLALDELVYVRNICSKLVEYNDER